MAIDVRTEPGLYAGGYLAEALLSVDSRASVYSRGYEDN